jgi:hypothetical protein
VFAPTAVSNRTRKSAEATKASKEVQQNIVQKTLAYFDDLADSLESIPVITTKPGASIVVIAAFFEL